MAQAVDILWHQLHEREKALVEARQAQKAGKERANASARALAKVVTALNFLVDSINQTLLFRGRLEKEDKVNRGQIIRFLLDQNWKMESTWEQMRELMANMTPEGPEARRTSKLEDLATSQQVIPTPKPRTCGSSSNDSTRIQRASRHDRDADPCLPDKFE